MSSIFKIVEHSIAGQHVREYAAATRENQNNVLKIAIKQYVPLQTHNPVPDDAVTILGFHGNGFPKETYEPLFEDLYQKLQALNIPLRGIWITDSSNQGASGVLNERLQGDTTSWFDHSRDVLHMVNHFREEMPRPIIGVAHSYGCAQLVHLSMLHPRLLSTVILMEPIIFDPQVVAGGPNPALPSTLRRDIWPSFEVASKSLRRAFGNWDPRSIDKYLEFGLRKLPTAVYNKDSIKQSQSKPQIDAKPITPLTVDSVTLTTTKAQESWSFTQLNLYPEFHDRNNKKLDRLLRPDQNIEHEWEVSITRPECALTMRELPFLRPSCLFVFGGNSPVSPLQAQDEKVAVTGTQQGGSGGVSEGKVKKVVIAKAGHLLTFEQASLSRATDACAEWLEAWFTMFREDERTMRDYLQRPEGQGRASDKDTLRLSEEWIAEMKKKPFPPARKTREIKGRL